MKKIMTLLATMAFALTFGVAFADESVPMAKDMSWGLYNGITYFDLGPGCEGAGGAGAGGVTVDPGAGEASMALKNGITYFELGSVETVKGSCSPFHIGVLSGAAPSAGNGITIFD